MTTQTDHIPFTWVVKEIHTDDRPGATVEFTPEDSDTYSVIEMFVPVPFHKATDKDHALGMLERKINARSPQARWRKEAAVDNSGDTDAIADEVREHHGLEKKQTQRTE